LVYHLQTVSTAKAGQQHFWISLQQSMQTLRQGEIIFAVEIRAVEWPSELYSVLILHNTNSYIYMQAWRYLKGFVDFELGVLSGFV